MLKIKYFLPILATLALVSCGGDDDTQPEKVADHQTLFDINYYGLKDDIALGKQTRDQIAADPTTYPVLDETKYPAAYAHIRRMRDAILNSGAVKYNSEFDWEIKIIHDDNTLNAFCAPGGYIYIYTGIIKYLDSEEQLAGVLGHEMGHADRRHSTRQLSKSQTLQTITDVILGEDKGLLTEVASGLINLKYSRDHEKEADECSVVYLCPTSYKADGAASFFEKIEAEGGSSTPAFLSTHPSPDKRVEAIKEHAVKYACTGKATNVDKYQDLKNSLP